MLYGIGNWENNNEISMLSAALNRLRLHCITETIQRRTKNLGNWLIFPRWQGGKLFQDIDVKRAPVYYFWDALRIRRLYSQWSDFVNRGQCNFRRPYVWVCVHVYLHYYGFSELSGSANSFRSHDLFIRSLLHSLQGYFSAWFFSSYLYHEISRLYFQLFRY